MIQLDFADVYITNVCNLNCTDCNRFNNFAFKGHQRWEDYKDDYEKWSSIVNIDHIVILGGEPMLNPDFLLWVDGITALWPSAKVEILTNGSVIDSWPDLYSRLSNPKLSLRMSAHSAEVSTQSNKCIHNFLKGGLTKTLVYSTEVSAKLTDIVDDELWALKYKQIKLDEWPDCDVRSDFASLDDAIKKECKDLFGFNESWGTEDHSNWIKQYNSFRAESWPDCNSPSEFDLLPDDIKRECKEIYNFYPRPKKHDGYKLTDENGVSILVMDSYKFYETMLKQVGDTVEFYNSDARVAHSNCCFTQVQWQCPQFSKGKIWKCGPVSVINDFADQFAISATEKQREIFTKYKPCSPDWDYDDIVKFINNLSFKIDACSLCSENTGIMHPIDAGFKKIKIIKNGS